MLSGTGLGLALQRDANPQPLFQVEHPLERLGEGPVVLIALPSEGPLGQLKLPLQLVAFPLGKPDPLGLDLGESLGRLRDACLQLRTVEAPKSRGLSNDRVGGDRLPQPHLLRLQVTDLHVRRPKLLVESLDLGMEVAGRDQGVQDREGMAHDDIRRAPVHQLGKLFEVQELEGLRDRVIQKGPDRRQAACIFHGSQRTGVALVGFHCRGRELGPVELLDLEISIRVHVFSLLPKGLQGVGAGQVPVVVLLVQVREKLSQQLLATVV